MESLRNTIIIIGQHSAFEKRKRTSSEVFWKDFRNKTLIIDREWQFGRQQRSSDILTHSRWRSNR